MNWNPLLLILGIFIGFGQAYSQCEAPTIDQADFCSNQRAEIRLTDPNPNVDYLWHWGDVANPTEDGYGYDGEGRYYVSGFPHTGTTPEDYYYIKQVHETAGPAYRAPAGGASYGMTQTSYGMTFDATMDFTLDSVTVVVELLTDDTYMFEVALISPADTAYSLRQEFTRGNLENISGDFYKVRFATPNSANANEGLPVAAGNGYVLEFRSVDDIPTNVSGVENIYWWDAGEYAGGGTYASNTITVEDSEKQVNVDTRTPLIMDWAVTLQCDMETVSTTLSSNCCTPVGDDFQLTTLSTNNLFKASEMPVDIDAAGTDINASMHYYWYDRDGNLLANGLNSNSYNTSDFGYFTLRVVDDPAFINSAACFGEQTILVDSATIAVFGAGYYCIGDNITLSATGGIGAYTWSSPNLGGAGSITTPNQSSTEVTITTPGTYIFEVEADVLAGDIVIDGTFSAFDDRTNTDQANYPPRFETRYGFVDGADGNGEITVQDDEIFAWGGPQCPEATYPAFYEETVGGITQSRGNFLYVDALSSRPEPALTEAFAAANYIWQLSNQPVEPGQTYNFTMEVAQWGASVEMDFMILVNGVALDLTVDGAALNNTIYSETDRCIWHTVTGTWNSGANTQATLSIAEVGNRDPNHEVAVDNITFSTGLGLETVAIEVEVDQITDPGTNEYCEGSTDPVTLDIDGVNEYEWFEDPNGTTVLSNSNSPGVQVTWNPSGTESGDQTFYVRNAGTSAIAGGSPFGPTSSNGYASASADNTDFSVYSTINLASVSVASPNGQCPTGNIVLRLTNTDDNSFEDISVPAPACNGTPQPLTLNKIIPPGNYSLAIQSGGNFNKTSPDYIASPNLYSLGGYLDFTGYGTANSEGFFFNWVVESSEACGSPAPIVVTAISCCNQEAPTASVSMGTATICVGGILVLEATPDGATTGPITYQWYNGNSPIAGATSNTYTVPTGSAAAAADYSVSVTSSASCTGESARSNAISVTVNELPTGDITIDNATICDDGTTSDVTLTATGGTGPYDFAWTEGATPNTQNNDADGSHVIATSTDQTYTLTGVTDDNGCVATDLGNVSVTLAYHPEVTASLDALSCPNGSDPEFDISINVSGGTPAYVITAVDDLAANVAGTVSGGTWTNDSPVDENRTVTITLTDGNGCNPVTITNLNQKCSCPESATLSITGDATVCEEGATTQSELTITFDDGTTAGAPSPTGTTSWFFQLLDQNNTVIEDYSAASYAGMTLVVPNVAPGTYRIENLIGDGVNGCPGSEGVSQTIDLHDSPAAAISGDQDKCDDGTSTATVTIDPSAGTGPMTFEYTGTTSGLLNSGSTSDDPYTFTTTEVETFTLTSVTDANGCTAKTADMTGQAVITGITPPTATITAPVSDPYLTGTDDVTITAADPGLGYSVNWAITSGQGAITTASAVSTQATGLTAKDPAPNSTSTVELTVSDDGSVCPADVVTIDITRVDRTVPDLGGNDTICETSGFPYVINTQPLIAGIETATLLQNAGGNAVYDNVANTITIAANPGPGDYTIQWEINNNVSGTTDDTMILTVDGAPDAAAYAGSQPEETCSETFQLDATPVVTGIGTWTNTSGVGSVVIGDENLANARVENLQTGTTSQFTWTTSNGTCTGTSVTVDVNKLADISAASIGMSGDLTLALGASLTADICQTGSYNILSSTFDGATEDGLWSVVSGSSVSVVGDNSNSQALTINSEGTTRVQWAISKLLGGCPDAEATLDITVHAAPAATVVATSTEECEGTSISLTGSTLDTTDVGTWTATGVGSVPAGDENLATISVTPAAGSTTYTYTIDNDGCAADAASETLTINPIATTSISSLADRTLCVGVDEDFTVTVTGMNGGNVTWTGYTPTDGDQGTTMSVVGAQQGSYNVTATLTSGDQCPDQLTRTETFSLSVVDGPTPTIAEANTTICENSSITLNGTRSNASNLIQWFNSAGAIVGVGDVTFTSVNKAETYYYTEDNGSCDPVKSNEVVISVEQQPAANTVPDYDVCFSSGDQLVLSGTISNTSNWIWKDASGTTIATNQNPVSVDVTTGGTYVYSLVAQGEFCDDDEDFLTVQVRSQIEVNNVFTPNGDGTNDVWNIAGIETYPEAIVRVFNKWGQTVFETYANYAASPWDGGGFPPSTYYYIIDLAEGGACGDGKQGYVEIMK